MKQKSNKMESMPIPKLVINISTPLMISLLVQSLYNIISGIFVARLGENTIAAVSFAFPIQMFMIAISVGSGIGVNSLVSRKIGEKNQKEIGSVATTGLLLAVLSSFVFVIFGLLWVRQFFELYTDNLELITLGVQYLRIVTVFSLGIFVATTVERLLQAAGKTVLSMIALITGAVINIVLCPILINGLFGFPALGVRGAAIATVIGQWAAAGLSLVLNLTLNKEVPIKIRGYKLQPRMFYKILKVGIPSMMSQGMASLMTALINNILGGVSVTAVAFFGIYYRLQQFLFMPVNGLSQGLIPIVGYNYGSRRVAKIKEAVKFSLTLAIGIMVVGTTLFMFIPEQLLSLYHASEDMLAFGVPALRIISVIFVPTGIAFVVGRMFIGMGNGVVNMVNTILMDLLTVVIIYILVAFIDIHFVWFAFWISHSIALVFSILSLRHAYQTVLRPMENPG